MSSPLRHYFVDMNGEPIDLLTWAKMRQDWPTRVPCDDEVRPGVRLRTVWLGIVDPLLGERPFGTAVSTGNPSRGFTELDQYDTRKAALDGHARHLARLRTE